jgi:hypothetical protein
MIEGIVMDKLAKPMLSRKVVLGGLGLLIALGMMFAGCATKTPMQAEMDLGSCGFKWKSADTPEKLKHLASLPQRKIVRHQKEGKSYYIYADAQECKCVYVGDEKAYQEYRQLVFDKNKVSSANMDVESMNLLDTDLGFSNDWIFFGLWGGL